ncbi:hypothetical protein SAMN05444365_103202 [Micromonospora pattaloongensis]|uniref:Uncharacterized protein n=1 Tax=Micromonospora pattaloongensis TaxID=405436 RepID=A0A1H3M455_9ACTN|nr:Rv3235 family protein [Micromonospora pattaloongensis]SDY70805.1 hypothetical protein SAMN05444365_103202 [Micromonospora pattaloongensis]
MPAVRAPARPAVRLRAAPPLDPPFDDEAAPQTWAGDGPGQLALDFALTPGPDRRPAAHGAATDRRHDGGSGDHPAGLPPGALAAASPEARQAARRFLVACLEIFNGYRPIGHARQLSSRDDAEEIIEQLATGLRRINGHRGAGRRPEPVRLRSLRVCEPRRGVAEGAAALSARDRTWAMAFRLERRGGGWVGTAAHLL